MTFLLPEEQGRFLSDKETRKRVARCLRQWICGLDGARAAFSRSRVFDQGKEVARLVLLRFREPGKLNLNLPRKIGP